MAIQHKKPDQSIKKELQAKGISQVQASYDLGLDRVAFNIWANGWERPSVDTRKRIAAYLDKPERELFPPGA